MIIELEKSKYYFLTYNNEKRKQHMLEEFKDVDINCVETIADSSKNKSGAIGFSKILDIATLHLQKDGNKVFQPFIIFEDDIKKYREFPKTIEIPDDADILYIGLSICGMNNQSWCNTVCYSNVNEEVIRIYNMLALHGIIICSPRGLLMIQKCMLESYFKDIEWDIFIAQSQPFYNVYALRKPLVYQYAQLGGQEVPTKIEYNELDRDMDASWINNTHLSVRTCMN